MSVRAGPSGDEDRKLGFEGGRLWQHHVLSWRESGGLLGATAVANVFMSTRLQWI